MDTDKLIDTAGTIVIAGMALGVADRMMTKSKPVKLKASKRKKGKGIWD